MCAIGDVSTSGLAAAILHLSLPVRSDSIGIALLLCVQLEFPHEEVITLFTNENGTPSDLSPVVPVVS